jgi:hypothetical protein
VSAVEELRAQLIEIVERLPLGQLLALGDEFNACLLDLARVSDGSRELDDIRHFVSNEAGEALTRAEDLLREAQSRLSLYAAML